MNQLGTLCYVELGTGTWPRSESAVVGAAPADCFAVLQRAATHVTRTVTPCATDASLCRDRHTAFTRLESKRPLA